MCMRGRGVVGAALSLLLPWSPNPSGVGGWVAGRKIDREIDDSQSDNQKSRSWQRDAGVERGEEGGGEEARHWRASLNLLHCQRKESPH